MKRLPIIAFALLALATVAAFFLIQHLKVTTPLIAGNPVPFPAVIDPVNGATCTVRTPGGQVAPVSFRHSSISFYLLYRSDVAQVSVADAAGKVVDKVSRGVFMQAAPYPVPQQFIRHFTWNGRTSSGAPAPPGRYYFRVVLRHQDRTITIADPQGAVEWVTVKRSVSCPVAGGHP
jgi:hypothetical protein